MTLGMAMIIFRDDTKAQSIQERMVSWTSLLKTKQTHIHSLTHKKPTKTSTLGKTCQENKKTSHTLGENICRKPQLIKNYYSIKQRTFKIKQ